MSNEICYWLFCFVPLSEQPSTKIFGFSEFLTAIALFSVVYMITDVRYKFRIAIAPTFLHFNAFVLIAIIGFQTLLTEIWISEKWWVPKTVLLTQTIWQGIFAVLFLTTFLSWMYYAFIRPPVFNRRNAHRFANELYRHILRGIDDELGIIANELARSAKLLVQHSRCLVPYSENAKGSQKMKKAQARAEDYAHDILLLIANRRFCRQIVKASPETALVIFEKMTNVKKFDIPIAQFARNISSEAILQTGSFLYEEDDGYTSGLLGYLKPVSRAIYGDFFLVETLAKNNFHSLLDIDHTEQRTWESKQWKGYCHAILITLKDCLDKGYASQHSVALYRAIDNIKRSYADVYKLNDSPEAYNTEIYKKLEVAVDFAREAIELIDKESKPPKQFNRVYEETYPKNIYDYLALLIFDICFMASTVKSPPETCWSIYYITVWSTFFSRLGSKGVPRKIICFKVRRLLYNEITKLAKWPNYKGSRILGFCLNVLGLETELRKENHARESYALAKAIHSWTKKNYLSMRLRNQDVANSVIIGSLSFDDIGNRLIKTYFKGLDQEAPKSYLELEQARE